MIRLVRKALFVFWVAVVSTSAFKTIHEKAGKTWLFLIHLTSPHKLLQTKSACELLRVCNKITKCFQSSKFRPILFCKFKKGTNASYWNLCEVFRQNIIITDYTNFEKCIFIYLFILSVVGYARNCPLWAPTKKPNGQYKLLLSAVGKSLNKLKKYRP